MSKETPDAPVNESARFDVPDAKRKSARRWFDQAKKLVEQRNYDYAIKSFIEGLYLNPEAVEEGHQPLRGCAVARWQTGGKKPGMMDGVKYSMTNKDPVKGLVNAAWLLAHDPTNAAYAEGLLKNANKAHCDDTLAWIGPIFRECLGREKKPAPKKFSLLKDAYEDLGARCQARGEHDAAIKAFELAMEAATAQRNVDPKNNEMDNIIRNISTRLTILKGNYQDSTDFRSSVLDTESQDKLRDTDRLVQSADRLGELIEFARADMEANPDVEAKVITYVNLLCKDETDEHENQAIELLRSKYATTENYRFKQRADDIEARQIGRHARLATAAGDAAKAKDLLKQRLLFELRMFEERAARYATDLRVKYEYAKRLFRCRRFDDAIPLFQQARNDRKVRNSCSLHLGRCFFEKQFYSQAAGTLQEAVAGHESTDDEVAKELNYWLGRALEADGKSAEARQTYGKLVQIDYNYRDVRGRLETFK